ncbi:putative metal-binding motif-containing protein [Corallococcus exiguus]|uniref:putative metal-binding motif-containing protein n=1 Tax=Corallococcus exiguus TaxID=83462 RepID=UPI001A8E1418|nr:putative metal-binding motif-containing protein [Corallococcus exiguus]MBN8467780.1 putative metal-binding motif-containing protein [Corallococcus exiguus]
MSRLCLLGCVLLLAACGEKAPDEGAIRVSVTYGSFKPACVRVEAKDAKGNQEATDILSSQFKNTEKNEVLVAVRRKADWDATLDITVSSYAATDGNRCSGEVVEHFTNAALTIVPKEYTRFDVTLIAKDGDGDGSPTGIEWAGISDCDDTRGDVRPGAVEQCDTAIDFDCDGKKACADSDCSAKTCTDGDLCNTGKRCVGVGESALCGGGTPKCTQAVGQCQATVTCEASTGACIEGNVQVGTACDPGNLCMTDGRCTADKQCVGTSKTCTTPANNQCQESTGSCNPTNGNCAYASKPVTTSCVDGDACHDPGFCDGNGTCIGKDTPCPPRECNTVAGCTRNTSCIYAGDPLQANLPCSDDNSGTPRVCSATGQCVAFPYTPSNFNPNTIPGDDIGYLTTTGAVVFDTETRTWTPQANGGPDTSAFKVLTQLQTGGAPEILLIPVRALSLGGELRIVGTRPVILAVYGDATLNHDILASGRIVNDSPIPGAGGNQACATSSQGKPGQFSGGQGGGGGGAGGATAGANGGKGVNSNATPGDAGPQQGSTPTPLLGGCAGGAGGGTGNAAGGPGGAGGGAFQISVARTLTVGKVLSVSGGGGLGGKAGSSSGSAAGGGGGGSGGRIVLEGFQVSLTSDTRITANGGGGGEGAAAGTGAADDGRNGASGREDANGSANGGTGGAPLGGDGGKGGTSAAPTLGENGGTLLLVNGGGGGGGGAAGSIHLRSIRSCVLNNNAVLSPAPTGDCPTPSP